MPHDPPQALTAAEFFARKLDGGTMMDAARDTGLGYETVRRIASGDDPDARTVGPVRQLFEWSAKLESARKARVYISAIRTLGLRA